MAGGKNAAAGEYTGGKKGYAKSLGSLGKGKGLKPSATTSPLTKKRATSGSKGKGRVFGRKNDPRRIGRGRGQQDGAVAKLDGKYF